MGRELVSAGRVVSRIGRVGAVASPGGPGGPYVVAFVAADIPPALRGRLQAALPPGSTELRGPVLAAAGASFRVTLPGLPAGKYRFETVTHAAYRMQGTLTVR